MFIYYNQRLEDVDWILLADVFQQAGLGQPSPADLKRSYMNSTFYVFAYNDTKLIGSARAISDGVYHALLCDTVVLPEWQGQGIGRTMVEYLLAELDGIKILLTASFGKEGFYRNLGFRRHKTAMARNFGPWWYEDDSGLASEDEAAASAT